MELQIHQCLLVKTQKNQIQSVIHQYLFIETQKIILLDVKLWEKVHFKNGVNPYAIHFNAKTKLILGVFLPIIFSNIKILRMTFLSLIR